MLRWDWNNDKVGIWSELHRDREYTYNLYTDNALLIMIAEWKESGTEKDTIANFFCDKDQKIRIADLLSDAFGIFNYLLYPFVVKTVNSFQQLILFGGRLRLKY